LTASASARRLLLVGALGRMGERVRTVLGEEPSLVLAAAVEAPGHPRLGERLGAGVALSDDLAGGVAASDVAIAFASPEGSLALLREAAPRKLPCVVGTTGFSAGQQDEIRSLSAHTPILVAANFSVAVNVLFHLARRAAALLGPGYDAEIVELHHGAKLDAPSGTALRLAGAVAEGRGEVLEERLVLTREGSVGARPAGAIGVRALRGGDNPGEHELLFLGAGERLELAHRSATRDHFARGAVRAACWLLERPPGLYDMEQVLGLR
jgi:4-hydroxy-tetrahydrodipicolinate reductase